MSRFADSQELLRELFLFARQNKVYWIVPLVLMLLVAALLIFTTQTTAPFVYTLF